MSPVDGPALGRRRLRAALRAARLAAGLTQEQVAAAMDWSLSKVIRIESGAVSVSTTDVRALVRLYGITDPRQVDELVALARRSRRRQWFSSLRRNLPAPYAAYIGLEAETSFIRYFHPTGLPNLFQTEAYAAASTFRGDAHHLAVRRARQRELLNRPDPPEVVALLAEGVLRRIADGPDDLGGQLEHLRALGDRPNITIQVLPFTAGIFQFRGPFAILQFPQPDADVMFLESAVADDVIDQPEVVGAFREEFDRARELALSPAETRLLITRLIESASERGEARGG